MTPWTVAYQAPLSMGFSREEYWSGLSFPPPGDLPDPGIESRSPALQADSLPTELQGSFSPQGYNCSKLPITGDNPYLYYIELLVLFSFTG